MTATSPDPVRTARSRVALATRYKNPTAAATARRELVAAKLERAIQEALAAAPPLTTEQRAKLARLLRDGGGAK